ncbi:MmpS family transport accessory protein [Nocardia sp. NBC_01329]|uniref:MmpS family transport accessory protein n=1 Tax=Nocardia sp. NBC_01329 TaxID=2903594 RepID=UPI002E103EF3|nr:MmpS family protein [Nocardia sp. NBC_01329]
MAEPPGERRYRPGRPGRDPDEAYPSEPTPASHRRARMRARWPWAVGGITLLILCLAGGCVAVVGGIANEVGDRSDRAVTVTYRVEGTGGDISITYLGNDLGMATETAPVLPWRREVTIDGFGTIVSLTAINDENGGEVTCRITVGDRVVSEQTSSGPYASAGCSGDAAR